MTCARSTRISLRRQLDDHDAVAELIGDQAGDAHRQPSLSDAPGTNDRDDWFLHDCGCQRIQVEVSSDERRRPHPLPSVGRVRRTGRDSAGHLVQSRIVGEDLSLDGLQRRRRLEPRLLSKKCPKFRGAAHCVSLTAASIEGHHEQSPIAFAFRMLGDECLEFGDHRCRILDRQLCLRPLVGRHQPELIEANRLAVNIGKICKPAKRGPSPEAKGGLEQRHPVAAGPIRRLFD